MKRCIAGAATALLMVAGGHTANAQVQAAGAPAEGVDVQLRYSSPAESQRLLEAPTATAPAQQGADSGAAGGVGGGDAPAPFVNDRVGVAERRSVDEPMDGSWIYAGVVPGDRDTLPHIQRTQGHGASGQANTLTWIGFQPFPESTRVFLQTGRAAQYQVVPGTDGLTITIRLRNTRIELSNFRRTIDASYFGRAVSSVDTVRGADGVTEVVIALTRDAEYTVTGEGEYLMIDFVE